MSTTLAQYRSAVASKLGLDNSVAGDQGFIDLWVNEGVTDILLRTGCKMSAAALSLTSGQKDYTLDTSILLIYDAYVTNQGVDYWMERTSVDEILAMRRTTTANQSPAQFYAVGGADLFMIYPTPSSSNDSVTFYYTPRPATLSVSSDTPSEIPVEFQKAVEYYALREGADFSDDATSQQGQMYLGLYEQWIRKINKFTERKGHHRMNRASVRRNRASIPFHDRSRYPGNL